jgi:hypothetical protein
MRSKGSAETSAPKTRWLWDAAIYLVAAAFFVLPRGGVFENDLFFHIAFGDWILGGGPMSGNPEWMYGPFENQNWINTLAPAEVIFALIYQFGGWTAIGLIRDLAIPALLLTIWFALTRWMPAALTVKTPDPQRLAFFAAPIITFAVSSAMTVRPQTWSYVLVPVLIAYTVRAARTGRLPNAFVVAGATWIWTCWHGYGLLVAPMLALGLLAHHVGAFFVSQARGADRTKTAFYGLLKASPAVFLALLATTLTPAGIGMYTSAAALKAAALGNVSEWQPVTLTEPLGLVLVGVTVAYLGALWLDGRKGRWRTPEIRAELIGEILILVAVLAVFTSAMRTAVLATLIVLLITAHRAITATTRPEEKIEIIKGEEIPAARWTAVRSAVLVIAVAASVSIYPTLATPGIDETRQPMDFINKIVKMPGERHVFVQYDSASAMMFAAQQAKANVKVSLDSRVDKYGHDIVDNHLSLDVKFEEEWWAPYESTSDAILHTHSALAKELIAQGWTQKGLLNGFTPDNDGITWVWLVAPDRLDR